MHAPVAQRYGITVLGATGSIGLSTLDVIARHSERYEVIALTANRDVTRMSELCRRFKPAYAVMADPDAAAALERELRASAINVRVLSGDKGLQQVAELPQVHTVMAAIVGAAGLLPTLTAARAGKRVLLANKEALVMAGGLFMRAVKEHHAQLLPVDSEHNAIFQCLPSNFHDGLEKVGVKRILLTASGGPFRDASLESLSAVTPDQACAHPNWVMGRKISVDSATMMNKGLEVIEARWLFDIAPDQIQVVLHPQSIVHSMVEYVDGSVLAQLGSPDMRTPIAHALAWPERIVSGAPTLDLFAVKRLDFEPPSLARFPCLGLAYEAIAKGGNAAAMLNAANEVAVAAFLDNALPFTAISKVIERTLAQIPVGDASTLDSVIQSDCTAREVASAVVQQLTR